MRTLQTRLAFAIANLIPAAGVIAAPPTDSKAGVVLIALAVLSALHGYGRLLATWADDVDAPIGLTLTWGLAAYVGFAGILIALHLFGPAARIGVIAAGSVLGTAWIWRNADRRIAGISAPRVGALLAIGFGVLVLTVLVLAAAGRWAGPFTDGDTDYLGQLRRLDDTGALADGFGFPRALGLGGQIAIAALSGPLDPRGCYVVDRGVLVIVLVVLALAIPSRPLRRPAAVIAALPLALTAVAEYLTGMAPFASLVVLTVGALVTLDRARAERPGPHLALAVLTASAAATIAHPALVMALALLVAASARVIALGQEARVWRIRIAAITAAVIVPYLATAARAWATSPHAPIRHAVPAVIGAGAGIAAVLTLLAILAVRDRSRRIVLTAACASVAAAGLVAPSMAALAGYALPIVAALALVVALSALSGSTPLGTTAIAITAVVGVLAAARFQAGGSLIGWRTRAVELIDDARAVGEVARADTTQLAARYAEAQGSVPAGVALAIWVDRPDLLQYDRNRVTDLRAPAARRLARALPHMHLDYVLVDDAAPGDAWQVLIPTSEETYRAGGLRVLAVDRHDDHGR